MGDDDIICLSSDDEFTAEELPKKVNLIISSINVIRNSRTAGKKNFSILHSIYLIHIG